MELARGSSAVVHQAGISGGETVKRQLRILSRTRTRDDWLSEASFITGGTRELLRSTCRSRR